jgi:hypothetical protein
LAYTGGGSPIYVRGEANLAAHKGGQATAEFQKILDHRAILGNSPLGALTRLQLARAYAMQGDKAKAKAAYQDFPNMFKTVSTNTFYSSTLDVTPPGPLNEEIMSPDTRLMLGLSLILVPTIVYGGLTVLGVVTNRLMGSPGPANLSPTQIAFYRAGHAHAGVLTLLAMVLQITVDYLRSLLCLSGQSVWEQSPHQFWFLAGSSPCRTSGQCALFFTSVRFWSRRQPLQWELG